MYTAGIYNIRSIESKGITVQLETFEGENLHELVKKTIFTEKTFTDCLLVLRQMTPCPNFAEKAFANSHKIVKFVKVFSIKIFLLYGINLAQNKEMRILLGTFAM